MGVLWPARWRHSLPLAVPTRITEPPRCSAWTASPCTPWPVPRVVHLTADLAAEHRLVEAAGRSDGGVDPATVDLALLETAANGVELNAGQVALVRAMACSGYGSGRDRPAGSGKTTAMRALAHSGRTPAARPRPCLTAAAAARWVTDRHPHRPSPSSPGRSNTCSAGWAAQIGPPRRGDRRDGMADTSRWTPPSFVATGAASAVGDDQQLAAIGAGGTRDIATRHGAARLNRLVRFADPAERLPRPARRERSARLLPRPRRVHVGDLATITEAVFDAGKPTRPPVWTIMLALPATSSRVGTRARSVPSRATLPAAKSAG